MDTKINNFLDEGDLFLPGNKTQLRLSLIALILNSNVLIEDVPGMGKTSLVKFCAKSAGLDFKRVQFTSDLLPSDILGVSIFNKESEEFIFKRGPVFGELILADELNRGTPKTQSALLQAMEEKKITVDDQTFSLPERFCIFATQNPRGQHGTYPLPESQLDRFLFKFSMGKLSKSQEVELLASGERSSELKILETCIQRDDLIRLEKEISAITASKILYEYISDILGASRKLEEGLGLSTRAGFDLLAASRAWAYFEERSYIVPDDIQAVFPFVAGHRMYSQHSLTAEMEEIKARDFVLNVDFIK